MAEPRSVVITGASRGLGFASACHLYKQGWRVVAAMRSVDAGMERLREATGARDDDPRLVGVQLDLTDAASVTAAAKAIKEAVGAPYGLVHNAGIYAAGMVEEVPLSLWEQMFATTIFGPVALTQPGVLYEYADPKIEALSAGQKALIRMGGDNATFVKHKLREIRAALVVQPKRN